MMDENWQPMIVEKRGKIFDLTGRYEVSDKGRVRNVKTNKILNLRFDEKNGGYWRIQINIDGKNEAFQLHRVVAQIFIPNPENKPEVDHIIPVSMGGGSEVTNLRWVTRKENINNPLTRKNYSECRLGEKHIMWGKRGALSPLSKCVVGFNLKTKQLKFYKAINETEKDGFTPPNVTVSCKSDSKTHKGWKWFYVDDFYEYITEKSE